MVVKLSFLSAVVLAAGLLAGCVEDARRIPEADISYIMVFEGERVPFGAFRDAVDARVAELEDSPLGDGIWERFDDMFEQAKVHALETLLMSLVIRQYAAQHGIEDLHGTESSDTEYLTERLIDIIGAEYAVDEDEFNRAFNEFILTDYAVGALEEVGDAEELRVLFLVESLYRARREQLDAFYWQLGLWIRAATVEVNDAAFESLQIGDLR